MKKTRRLSVLVSSLLVGLSPLTVMSPAFAAADTCTWTGAASNDNFSQIDNPGVSQTTNWNCSADGNNTVPEASGDNLVFNNDILSANITLNNDISGLSVVDITFAGASTANQFTIGGAQAITVTGNITNSSSAYQEISTNIQFTGSPVIDTGSKYLYLTGDISQSGTGAITKNGTGDLGLQGNNTFGGVLNVTAGSLSADGVAALGAASAGTTIANGASVNYILSGTTDQTIAEPFTVAGDGGADRACALGGSISHGQGFTGTDPLAIFSGNITLTADTTICPEYDGQTKLTGALSGNYKISVPSGSVAEPGSLIIAGSSNTTQTPNGTYEAAKVETTLSDSQPTTSLSVGYNETVILTGSRGDVNVGKGGILKGSGTVGTLWVDTGGHLAPGLSPGCLNSGNTTINGSFDVEIGGTTACTGYDQLKVTGTVDVTGGTLNTTLYNGFVPAVGQTYTIIDNDGADAITGTFTGLAQGASVTSQGVTYSISYTGGDGNDVVLTVTAIDASALPGAPNTGLGILTSHPLVTLMFTTAAAAGLFVTARRYGYAAVKVRK